ncbi:MAG: transglutaminase domain-containing protein [Chloroflexi bacterium]|nr:transglutaminase domain-containing protein [Chloroflexota bacterium]
MVTFKLKVGFSLIIMELTAEQKHFPVTNPHPKYFSGVSPSEGIFGRLITGLLILTVLMAGAALGMQIADLQFGEQSTVLSLKSVVPPSDTPLFMVEGSPGARYLRGAVGTVYDGTNWKLKKAEDHGQDLSVYSSKEPLALRPVALAESHLDYDRDVLNQTLVVTDSQYRILSDDISDRIKDLSLEITEDFKTPFEKAKAIEVFLKLNCTYYLGFEPAPSGWEPNDWFLFESQEGICGNFASAFVVLARASELPARLAVGYYVRSGEGEQMVYDSQAHAWAEVGFEGLGWLAFDAT